VLGRGTDCDLVLGGDAQVAERHAAISESHGEFAIEPIGGLVKIEDVPIETSHPLGDGDTIEIGQSRYVFKCVTTGNLAKSSGGFMKIKRHA
jgi:predicted component of type VI protein secretion system